MSPKTVGIEVILLTSDKQRRELLLTLEGFQNELAAAGCGADCGFFEDAKSRNRFLWIEWWASREETEQAMRSPRFHALLGAVRVLGRLEGIRLVHPEAVTASMLGRVIDTTGKTEPEGNAN